MLTPIQPRHVSKETHFSLTANLQSPKDPLILEPTNHDHVIGWEWHKIGAQESKKASPKRVNKAIIADYHEKQRDCLPKKKKRKRIYKNTPGVWLICKRLLVLSNLCYRHMNSNDKIKDKREKSSVRYELLIELLKIYKQFLEKNTNSIKCRLYLGSVCFDIKHFS